MEKRNTRIAENEHGKMLRIEDYVHDVHGSDTWYCLVNRFEVTAVAAKPNKEYEVTRHWREKVGGKITKRGKQKDFIHHLVCGFLVELKYIDLPEFSSNLSFISSDTNTVWYQSVWMNKEKAFRADVIFKELLVEVYRTSSLSKEKLNAYRNIEVPFLAIHVWKDDIERSKQIEEAIVYGDKEEVLKLLFEDGLYEYSDSVDKYVTDVENKRIEGIVSEYKADTDREVSRHKHDAIFYKEQAERVKSTLRSSQEEIQDLKREISDIKNSDSGEVYAVAYETTSGKTVYKRKSKNDKGFWIELDPSKAYHYDNIEDAYIDCDKLTKGNPRVVLLKPV